MNVLFSSVAVGTACSLIVTSYRARGQEDEASLKQRVQKEYPAALKALESRFARAYGFGRSSEELRIGTDGHFRSDSAVTFASRRPALAKVVLNSTRTTIKDGKTGPPREVVFCYNSKNSFWLARPAGDSKYTVQSLVASNSDGSMARRQLQRSLRFLDAPCTVGTLRMSAAFERPGFSIQRVSTLHRDGKLRLKIEFAVEQRGGSGWVVVAPDEKWALCDYEYKDIQDSHEGKIEYTEPLEGYPCPKRVTITRTRIGETLPAESYKFDFDEIHSGDAPDREFTLGAFGLAD
jgi:hypothetical protein